MAILDIFKKKKKAAPKGGEPRPAKTGREVKKPSESKLPTGQAKPTKVSGIAYRVLKKPHVAEKSTDLIQKNQYVFEVVPRANKVEIRKAIEDLYGVDVVSVRIINIPRKKRKLGRIEGWRKGYKKAIVKIKEGQKIEVLPR